MKFNSGSLVMTDVCNLGCKYCYMGTLPYTKDRSRYMSHEVGYAAVEMFIDGAKFNKEEKISITFFGGEPTLNLNEMYKILKYADERTTEENLKLDVTLITNATIFNDELVNFIELWNSTKAKIFIQISLDGGYESQNTNRPFKNGELSADTLIHNIKQYQNLFDRLNINKDNLKLHPVLTKQTIGNLYDDYLFIRSLGFNGAWTQLVQEEDWDEKDAEIYKEQLYKIANTIIEEYKNGNKKPYHAQSTLSKCDIGQPEKLCSAGLTYCSITTNGDIYPCHRFNRDPKMKLGNIYEKNINLELKETFENFYSSSMIGNKSCSSCNNYNCFRCIAANYEQNGSINIGFPKYCAMVDSENEVQEFLNSTIDSLEGRTKDGEMLDIQKLLLLSQKDQITMLENIEKEVSYLREITTMLSQIILGEIENGR